MKTMKIFWDMAVKKAAYGLSGPFVKIRGSQTDNDSSNLPEKLSKNVFPAKSFDWNVLYGYCKLFN